MIDFPLIWALLILFALMAYVVLDGLDLGVGILFPFIAGEANRDIMMHSVAPVWDGNETWLVLAGGGLFAVFPLAYAIIMPALYIPIFLMLLALVFRGVAFEFRFKERGKPTFWDVAFAGGSTVAAFAQGMILGGILEGIQVDGRSYAGGALDWLSPFSIFTGVAVVIGYALLGSTWLVMKTEGEVYQKAKRYAPRLLLLVLVSMVAVSVWTANLHEYFLERWLIWPDRLYVVIVPFLVLYCAWTLLDGLKKDSAGKPYLAAVGLFVVSYIGLAMSVFPYFVPPSVTLWEAAAPDKSLHFLLVGSVVLIPTILAYSAYAYWVFRGKVSADSHGYDV
jgi:cytochrome d ubiquinol oxidase subunit II